MTTLFNRLVGFEIPEVPGPGDGKVGIHAFAGGMDEFFAGHATGADMIGWFDLVDEDTDDAIYMKDLMAASSNKTAYMRVYKDYLYMGETSVAPKFTDELSFWTRMRTALTDNGDTPPSLPQHLIDRLT